MIMNKKKHSQNSDVKHLSRYLYLKNNMCSCSKKTFDSKSFYLHASSVISKKGALIFVGHSASGKTTISDILNVKFQKVEDDMVLLFEEKPGRWFLKDRVNKSTKQKLYPVFAIFRLLKAQNISIEKINKLRLVKILIDAYFEVESQRVGINKNNNIKAFKTINKFAKLHNGWDLKFSLKSDIINFVNKNLSSF